MDRFSPAPTTGSLVSDGGNRGFKSITIDKRQHNGRPIDASPLACTCLGPAQVEPTMNHANGERRQKLQGREWGVHSILEVFSVTKNRWYVAFVESAEPGEHASQMLWLRFWDENNDPKKKLVPRDDQSLATFGTHTRGQLPPGFQVQASQSRPGASAFVDAATCMKYTSAEVAWNVHFKRIREGPAVASEQLEETAPVPRRSPFAIAAGIAEEVLPRKQAPPSKPAPTSVALAPAANGEDRWNNMKSKFIEMEAEGQMAANGKAAKRLVAEADAEIECKEKPERYCPQLSPLEAEHALASRTQLPTNGLSKAKCKTFDIR
jgi:hypothetical protein